MIKKILAALFLCTGFCTLLFLGTWQLQRLHWKEGLIAQQQAAQQTAPLSLDALIKLPEDTQQFRTIRVEGQFLPEKRLLVGIRAFEGKSGYYSVIPFKISGGEFNGAHLLVTLGWLPFETAKNWQPPAILSKTLEIIAVTRPAVVPTWLTPANKPEKDEWYSLYIPEIASFHGLKPFLPFSAQLTQPLEPIHDLARPLAKMRVIENQRAVYSSYMSTGSADNMHLQQGIVENVNRFLEEINQQMPLILPQQLELTNNHLQYAITWYVLAGILLIMVAVRLVNPQK